VVRQKAYDEAWLCWMSDSSGNDVMISSQYSPPLANALLKGTVDAAFLRREQGFPELAFRHPVAHTAPVLREVIDNYLKRSGVRITPAHEIDHVVMGMTVIAPTRGVGLLPAYAQDFLNRSVTSRPLKGKAPTVDLVLGYKKSNKSPILKLLLSRLDELVASVSKRKKSVSRT
jgi:LysR family hca operon transcriptional activator